MTFKLLGLISYKGCCFIFSPALSAASKMLLYLGKQLAVSVGWKEEVKPAGDIHTILHHTALYEKMKNHK